MGFWGPGNGKLIRDMGIELDESGHVRADRHQMTNMDDVFVASDMTTGQSLVVRAINSGRQAAQEIVHYLMNRASR